jgi:hypothetical protein
MLESAPFLVCHTGSRGHAAAAFIAHDENRAMPNEPLSGGNT